MDLFRLRKWWFGQKCSVSSYSENIKWSIEIMPPICSNIICDPVQCTSASIALTNKLVFWDWIWYFFNRKLTVWQHWWNRCRSVFENGERDLYLNARYIFSSIPFKFLHSKGAPSFGSITTGYGERWPISWSSETRSDIFSTKSWTIVTVWQHWWRTSRVIRHW